MFPNIVRTQPRAKAANSVDLRQKHLNRSFIEDYYQSSWELSPSAVQNQRQRSPAKRSPIINVLHPLRLVTDPGVVEPKATRNRGHRERRRISRRDVERLDDTKDPGDEEDSQQLCRSPIFGYSEGERKRLAITHEYRKYVKRLMLRRSRSSSPQLEKIKAYAYQTKRAAEQCEVKIKTMINRRPEGSAAPDDDSPQFPSYRDEETQAGPEESRCEITPAKQVVWNDDYETDKATAAAASDLSFPRVTACGKSRGFPATEGKTAAISRLSPYCDRGGEQDSKARLNCSEVSYSRIER